MPCWHASHASRVPSNCTQAGHTEWGVTAWKQHKKDVLYLDVDTRAAGFQVTSHVDRRHHSTVDTATRPCPCYYCCSWNCCVAVCLVLYKRSGKPNSSVCYRETRDASKTATNVKITPPTSDATHYHAPPSRHPVTSQPAITHPPPTHHHHGHATSPDHPTLLHRPPWGEPVLGGAGHTDDIQGVAHGVPNLRLVEPQIQDARNRW